MIIVVAYNKKRVIGAKGCIPWHVPEDIQHFKQVTGTSPVCMGRKTWESLPIKPLPHRLNIVVSRTKRPLSIFYKPQEPMWANSLQDALRIAGVGYVGADVFLIGGAEMYREALSKNLVTKVIASEIDNDEDGDVLFPELDPLQWQGQVIKEYADFKVWEFTYLEPRVELGQV